MFQFDSVDCFLLYDSSVRYSVGSYCIWNPSAVFSEFQTRGIAFDQTFYNFASTPDG
jgi:hypothetical protein